MKLPTCPHAIYSLKSSRPELPLKRSQRETEMHISLLHIHIYLIIYVSCRFGGVRDPIPEILGRNHRKIQGLGEPPRSTGDHLSYLTRNLCPWASISVIQRPFVIFYEKSLPSRVQGHPFCVGVLSILSSRVSYFTMFFAIRLDGGSTGRE